MKKKTLFLAMFHSYVNLPAISWDMLGDHTGNDFDMLHILLHDTSIIIPTASQIASSSQAGCMR